MFPTPRMPAPNRDHYGTFEWELAPTETDADGRIHGLFCPDGSMREPDPVTAALA